MTGWHREMRRMMRRFEPSPEARITDALGKLLAATEAGEVSTTAAAAALGRHGENLCKAGGCGAMRTALDAACAERPDLADQRRAMIITAWAGIEGWTP